MNAAEFKKKWSRYQGKETSAYQGHFDDLCRLLGQPTPAEADPSGSNFFCYQKRVAKDAELFDSDVTPDASEHAERGFADVWKKGCFAWEYKGKKKNLDEAYRQLLRYRESLLNPPLLVVCDFDPSTGLMIREDRFLNAIWPQVGEPHDLHFGQPHGTFFTAQNALKLAERFPPPKVKKKKP
jgi:hypothetical protein